jgi:hypothetical protein
VEPSTELSGAEPIMEPWGDELSSAELSNAEPIIESSGAVPIINRQGH